ncbi:hypothetical protein V1517DRAFT_187417 [Lipomyces orientalis]|uniref:Uncharacterized protein n=1 Tax=Lipomyces orientalis TaxID=1233043 RepID=A0ACC3TIF0_9ASCO
MTDQTFVFYELCRGIAEKKGVPCSLDTTSSPDETSSPNTERNADAYSTEAKQIYSHVTSLHSFLIAIRPSYLSTSTRTPISPPPPTTAGSLSSKSKPLTNVQRDEIDYESRMILQQCLTRVRRLESLESKRQHELDNITSLARFFRDPKEDARNAMLGLHRRGVTQFLNYLLTKTSELQTELQEVRVSREAERAKSMLNSRTAGVQSKISGIITVEQMLAQAEQQDEPRLEDNPALLQQLEQENAALLAEFQETLEQTQHAEKSLYEIAALQGELEMHLAHQSEMTQQLYDEAVQTMGDVRNANTQLQTARKRNRIASKIIIFISLFLALFLLFVDYATS